MKKEKSKPTETKSNSEGGSKKADKTKKEDASSTSPPEQTSVNKEDPKSNSSESPNSKKQAYVRGESQKPVTDAYRKNWQSIFKQKEHIPLISNRTIQTASLFSMV